MAITNQDIIRIMILRELCEGDMETKEIISSLASRQVMADNKNLYNLITRLVQAGHISKDEDSGLISINETGREIVEEYRMSFEAFAENEKVEGSDDCDTKPQQKAAEPGEKPRVEMEELTKLWDEIRSQLFYDGSRIRIKKKDNGVSYRVRGPQKNHCRKSPFNAMRGFWDGERKIKRSNGVFIHIS